MSNFIQSPKHAVVNFGLENSVLYNNYPLHKFEFAIRIIFNEVVGQKQRKADALTFVVKNVKLPSVSIPVEEMNEYNRTRLNYGRLNFGDCDVVLHDVADGKVLNFWKDYYEYFFSDGKGRSFGYSTLLIADKNRKYYIEEIEIYQFHAGKSNCTTLVNPKITSFDQGTVAYDDITGLSEISIAFKPEYVKYKTGIELPEHVLDNMLKGAPAESIAQFIAAELPPLKDPAELDSQIASELSGTAAESLRSRFLQDSADSFNVQDSVPVERVKASSSSSLDSLGVMVTGFKTIGKTDK